MVRVQDCERKGPRIQPHYRWRFFFLFNIMLVIQSNCMDALKASLPGPAHLAFHNTSNRKLGLRLCIKIFQLARVQLVRQQLSWCMALHSLRALEELVSVWYNCVQNRARERLQSKRSCFSQGERSAVLPLTTL